MKINDILNEGDVIKTKFTQKQQSKNKTPYHYKNFEQRFLDRYIILLHQKMNKVCF